MYPVVLHFTHPKAASQWVRGVLLAVAPYKTRKGFGNPLDSFYRRPLIPGGVYGALFVRYPNYRFVTRYERFWQQDRLFDFRGIPDKRVHIVYLWNALLFRVLRYPLRVFFVIRDLRDTLVSFYFSVKYSHPLMTEPHKKLRERLLQINMEEGLIEIIQTWLQDFAAIQESWINRPEVLIVRYEDLVTNPSLYWRKIIKYCGWRVSETKLQSVLEGLSFERLSGGRKRGQENYRNHYRKGMPGDWKNYFTKPVKEAFKLRYGELLIKTGYENDLNW